LRVSYNAISMLYETLFGSHEDEILRRLGSGHSARFGLVFSSTDWLNIIGWFALVSHHVIITLSKPFLDEPNCTERIDYLQNGNYL